MARCSFTYRLDLALLLLLVLRLVLAHGRSTTASRTDCARSVARLRRASRSLCSLPVAGRSYLIVGIVAQFARGDTLSVFGLYEIASPWVKDRAFARSVTEIHEIAANALVVPAALHAVAALVHHWVFRDRTLVRMLPGS